LINVNEENTHFQHFYAVCLQRQRLIMTFKALLQALGEGADVYQCYNQF